MSLLFGDIFGYDKNAQIVIHGASDKNMLNIITNEVCKAYGLSHYNVNPERDFSDRFSWIKVANVIIVPDADKITFTGVNKLPWLISEYDQDKTIFILITEDVKPVVLELCELNDRKYTDDLYNYHHIISEIKYNIDDIDYDNVSLTEIVEAYDDIMNDLDDRIAEIPKPVKQMVQIMKLPDELFD